MAAPWPSFTLRTVIGWPDRPDVFPVEMNAARPDAAAHLWDGNIVPDPPLNLDAVIARFPDKGLLIRELCLSAPSFRSLCEEYGLARMSLMRFESLNHAKHPSEIEEYRTVITALEVEISRFLARSA